MKKKYIVVNKFKCKYYLIVKVNAIKFASLFIIFFTSFLAFLFDSKLCQINNRLLFRFR